jgi:NACHT domain
MAGTGKSTIARTIAQEYHNRERLGASFFFSRGAEDRSHAGKFFTTIAAQLAHISPELKKQICREIARHNIIDSQSQRDQWKHFILQPLSSLMADSCQSPLILVIDALDECDGDSRDVKGILQIFTEAKSLELIQLKIFITSRPETPIRLGFHEMQGILHQDLALHQISRTIVNNDILIFFEHKLEEIRNASNDLPVGWPGKEKINTLVLKSHGLFIYAATVCRFIEQGGEQWPPDHLLRLILPNETTDDRLQGNANMIVTNESPTKDLDKMYSQILEHSFKDIKITKDRQQLASIFRQVVGAIAILLSPLSVISITRLLAIDGGIIQRRLRHLHSVLEVPENQENPIRLLHPSFRDFLLDKERCFDQDLYVDEKKGHKALADVCIRLMSNKLRRDICDLKLPGALAKEVHNHQIEQHLPAEVQYACQYWVQHLQRSKTKLLDNKQVHIFLQEHLLHWLEALSLIGKTSEGVLAVISLESLVIVSDSPSVHRETLTNL